MSSLYTPLVISFQQLQSQVGTTIYTRGHDVLRRNKVKYATTHPLDDGTVQINATTQGTNGENYGQAIVLDTTGLKQSIRGFCTCPVDYNCKHVVAAVLKVSTDLKERLTLPTPLPASTKTPTIPHTQPAQSTDESLTTAQRWATIWLKKLAATETDLLENSAHHQGVNVNDAINGQSVVYVIQYNLPYSNQSDGYENTPRLLSRLTLAAYLSKPRSNGKGWLKPKVISQNHEPLSGKIHHNSEQAEALRLIKLLSSYGTLSHPSEIKGKLGRLALEVVWTQPHVFLTSPERDDLTVSVQHGATLKLRWYWRCIDANIADPVWQLSWQTIDAQEQDKVIETLFYAGPPALYVDVLRGVCGTVDIGTLSISRLNTLLESPALPASVIRAQETNFRQMLGNIALPPILEAMHTVSGIKPTVQLLIKRLAPHERSLKGWVSITPHFIYGEYKLPWNTQGTNIVLTVTNPNLTNTTANKRIMLLRDVDGETNWLGLLEQLGLWHHNHAEWFFLPPHSQAIWLQWAGEDYANLKALGFEIVLDSSMTGLLQQIDNNIHINLDNKTLTPNIHTDTLAAQGQWFNLSLGVEIDGRRQDILPWIPDILDSINYTDLNSITAVGSVDAINAINSNHIITTSKLPEWVYLPRSQDSDDFIRLNIKPLHPWLSALMELMSEREKDFKNGSSLRLSQLEALRMSACLGEGAVWTGSTALQAMLAQLKGQLKLPEVAPPIGLQATLRPYQQHGLNWLQFLHNHGLSGVLADDMGLGKTLQTLAHILLEKQSGRMVSPVLVVAPVSLMGNWAREAQRFTPELRVQIFHGLERHAGAETLLNNDIVLTSYALLTRERKHWLATRWHIVVLDEAQNIKNANSHAAKLVSELQAKQRLCLSGTPMENHLGELWSLFHFLMPGFLSSHAKFTEWFRTPIEKHNDYEKLNQLRQRVTPFMLRRNKSAVAAELPPKVESITHIKLDGKQADLYETIRLTTEATVRNALASKGLARSQITVLDALLKLRQVCCDPRLVPLDKAQNIHQSAKLEQLMEMLPEMLAEGRRVLLFSQFTSMLELIEIELKKHQLKWVKLTGKSTQRDAIIEKFTSGQVPLFLISLKAGGVGLNLSQADTVIHYDPWWNPAVENQATDRAHRIGQQSTVFVYKMVAQGTIEERILALQARKAELANTIYDAAENRNQPLFTENDIMELLKPLNH